MSDKINPFQVKAEYVQESDCCADNNLSQILNIETHDGGGGVYYTISTERWAFDNIENLVETLKDFMKRSEGAGFDPD